MRAWLAGSLQRQFPLGPPGRARRLRLPAARGESVSFQACVRPGGFWPVEVEARAGAADGLDVRVRRVGCVPVPHHNTKTPRGELDGLGFIPGYVPDVLYPEAKALCPPGETTSFWITVRIGREVRPGPRRVVVELSPAGERPLRLEARIEVAAAVLPPRRNFRVTHWFYADALCDRYGVEPFGAAFWPLCRRYMENYAAHGNDTVLVPVFTPSLDGVKRPTQLLRVRRAGRDAYRFDWSDVRRWVRLARSCGVTHFELPPLFTQWGVKNAIRIYEGQGAGERLLWRPETGATSETYRRFLGQFLPELQTFLRREHLLEKSFFHVSDEPHDDKDLANYRRARAMLRELAPWMSVMDALTDIRYGRERITDMPVPSIKTARQFFREGIPSWCYFCCGPRGRFLNRLLDTPLAKVRMSGWLFYRFGFRGFLHWGYNYWYRSQTRQTIDPFQVTDGLAWPGWAYGDTSVVYPGPEGPLDSIRWEVFAESLQDYALLESAGVGRDDRLLHELRGFDDFPKSERWIASARDRLLDRLGM